MMASMALVAWTCALLATVARSECQGNSCPVQHAAATAQGLLGSTSCTSRVFPYSVVQNYVAKLDSEAVYTAWSGQDDEWVWVITLGTTASGPGPHQVHLSSDKGKSFRLISPSLVEAIKTAKTAAGQQFSPDYDTAHSSVSQVFAHPLNPKKVLLWGDGVWHFLTEDGGSTWRAVGAPVGTYGMSHLIKPHPTQHDWLLTMALRNACYDTDIRAICTQDLFYSPDFGATWQNLTTASRFSGFTDFDWGWHSSTVEHDATYDTIFGEKTILASAHAGAMDPYNENAGNTFQLYRTDDFFKSTKTLADCGNAFELVAGQVFFARSDICPTDMAGHKRASDPNDAQHVSIYVSEDGTNFAEACLPTQLKDRSYMMISAHDGRTAFMIADHDYGANPVSNVYANGNIAELYSLSLRNVYFGFRRASYPDLTAIAPIAGRYIANQELSSNPDHPYRIDGDDFDTVAVTLITTNAGASWSKIVVNPSAVSSPICKAACVDPQDCFLHLHGQSSWVRGAWGRPAVYSSPSAPGLVMASGNLGPAGQGLSLDKDKLCTWLSTDGGITWRDIVDDMYIYEFFNHGNGIVIAKFREEGPAQEVRVSLDRGQCWSSIQIVAPNTADEIYIDNIRVEPDGAARIFHVIGTVHSADNPNSRKAVIITIDVAEIMSKPAVDGSVIAPKVCDPVADIEDWQPSTASNQPMCILGSYHKIKRRGTSNTPCLLAKDFERKAETTEACDCTASDLLCEYGYEKDGASKCVPMITGGVPECAAIADGRYKPSQSHLRLARHGTCPNLSTFVADTNGNGNIDEKSWGPKAKSSGSSWWVWLLVILGLAAGVVGFMKFASESAKDTVMNVVVEPVIGGLMWAMEKAQQLFHRVTSRDHRDLGFERLQASNQPAADDGLYAAP